MSFSYDADNPGNRDKLRLQIGDTTSTSYVFEDAELNIFLDRAGNDIFLAAAMACRALAVNHARRAVWYRTNNFWFDRRDPARQLLKMAEGFEAQAKSAVFEYESVTENAMDSTGDDISNYIDSESSAS